MSNARRTHLLIAVAVAVAIGNFGSNLRELNSRSGADDISAVPTGVKRLADRVVVIVLDSLPVRVGHDPEVMPELVLLAGRGASGVLRTPRESNTSSGVRALGTGVSTNPAALLGLVYSSEVRTTTVFDELIARGETVGFNGAAWSSAYASRDPETALAAGESTWDYLPVAERFERTLERLRGPGPPALSVVHVGETDRLAHLYGTQGQRYTSALREVDVALGRFVQTLLDGRSTVIVTSDHGADLAGKHGGSAEVYRRVPVVMIGAGIRRTDDLAMDARALPGVLAALLGVPLPGAAQATLPVEALALSEPDGLRLRQANATQLRRMATAKGPLPPGLGTQLDRLEVASAQGDSRRFETIASVALPQLLEHVASREPPSHLRFMWVAAIFATALLLGLHLPQVERPDHRVEPLLWGGMGFALLAGATPILPGSATLLSATCIALAARHRWAALDTRTRSYAAVSAACLAGVVVVCGVRFLYMDLIKQYVGDYRSAATSVAVLVGLSIAMNRRARTRLQELAASPESAVCAFIGLVAAQALLQPFSSAPALMVVAASAALVSIGRPTMWTAVPAGLMAAFFVFADRVVFAWTGEATWTRYAFAVPVALLFSGAVDRLMRETPRRVATPMFALGLLWPFGYLKVLGHDPGQFVVVVTVAISLGVAAARALRRGVGVPWLAPVATTCASLLGHSDGLFLFALVLHVGTFLLIAAYRHAVPRAAEIVALTAYSALALMTQPFDLPSLPMLLLGLLGTAWLLDRQLPREAVLVAGAAALVFARYAVLDLYVHEPSVRYGIDHFDLAAGFYAFGADSLPFAIFLVGWKMLLATWVVFAVLSASRRFREHLELVMVLAVAGVSIFLLRGSVEAALSYGNTAGMLTRSLGGGILHTVVLLMMVAGYTGFRALVIVERSPDIARREGASVELQPDAGVTVV